MPPPQLQPGTDDKRYTVDRAAARNRTPNSTVSFPTSMGPPSTTETPTRGRPTGGTPGTPRYLRLPKTSPSLTPEPMFSPPKGARRAQDPALPTVQLFRVLNKYRIGVDEEDCIAGPHIATKHSSLERVGIFMSQNAYKAACALVQQLAGRDRDLRPSLPSRCSDQPLFHNLRLCRLRHFPCTPFNLELFWKHLDAILRAQCWRGLGPNRALMIQESTRGGPPATPSEFSRMDEDPEGILESLMTIVIQRQLAREGAQFGTRAPAVHRDQRGPVDSQERAGEDVVRRERSVGQGRRAVRGARLVYAGAAALERLHPTDSHTERPAVVGRVRWPAHRSLEGRVGLSARAATSSCVPSGLGWNSMTCTCRLTPRRGPPSSLAVVKELGVMKGPLFARTTPPTSRYPPTRPRITLGLRRRDGERARTRRAVPAAFEGGFLLRTMHFHPCTRLDPQVGVTISNVTITITGL
ncbi:hypothetical protein BC826DRAFT_969032 [Russula brevipes]|nr:hypothetical protein BC826DRAFT_969032 [Russula brevipes]